MGISAALAAAVHTALRRYGYLDIPQGLKEALNMRKQQIISEYMLHSPNGKTMFSSASSGSSVDVAAELAPEAVALLDVTDDVVASSSSTSTSSVVPLPTRLVVATAGVFVAPPVVVMSSASSSSTSCSSVVTISTTGVVEGTVPAVGLDEEVVLVPVITELADVAPALVAVAVAVAVVVEATVWAAVVTEFCPSVVGMVDEGAAVIPREELPWVTVCEAVVARALSGVGDVAAIVLVVGGADDAVVVDSTAADGVVVCGGGVVVAGVVRPILTRYSSRYCWYVGLSCARKLSTCRTPRCLGDREK